MSDSEKKCNLCSKKANVFLSTVIEYEVIQVSFCQKHAEDSGLFDPKGYCFLENETPRKRRATGPACPRCQCSLKEFERSGKVGCLECYETFSGYIQKLVARIQKGPVHFGKIPSGKLTQASLRKRIKLLKDELQGLIKAERFEEAAQLRDYIHAIEKRLKSFQDE
mgnify:CR=1 FL=1|tara:strand:- start:25161 stop:25658 length:498 start_codon:yes stop_codon:yes gene_type:complete